VTTSSPASVHAPWQPGQYVTYVLTRGDGSWAAFALRVLGQAEDGAWVIRGDFKTVGGECHVWFRSDPNAAADAMDPVPARQQAGRNTLPADDPPDNWLARPDMQITLALNVLLVGRSTAALEALRQPGRPASHACGIDVVWPFVSPAIKYEKHHDLSPRVPVTGVAGMTVNGKDNPIWLTSFGRNDPQYAGPAAYEDHVDWSHFEPTVHDGFTVSYPATWFLLPQPQLAERAGDETLLVAQLGGNTCAASFSVSLRGGSPEDLRRYRQETLARLRTRGGDLTPDPAPLRFAGGAEGVAADYATPGIVGLSRNALYPSEDGGRLAHVSLFGCVSRSHPRRDARLAEMGPAFGAILESMRLT
jgi:hypothetical protein